MKKGFTLAEVLITLAIIGVVAALTIPSVIINAREQGNVASFKKAVSVLNSAISLNIAVDMTGPSLSGAPASSSDNLIKQLTSKMNVIQSGLDGSSHCTVSAIENEKPVNGETSGTAIGCSFTTADGMQFILPTPISLDDLNYRTEKSICIKKTAAQGNTPASYDVQDPTVDQQSGTESCTTGYTLKAKGSETPASTLGVTAACTSAAPCFVVVDVNGTNAPNKLSNNLNSKDGTITDRFVIAVTNDGAMAAGEQAKSIMSK